MGPSTLPEWIARRRSGVKIAPLVRITRRVFMFLCPLSLCVLVLAGCTGGRRAPETAKVSGVVRIDGNPLPGGDITFVSVEGGWVGKGTIDKDGHYSISAPVGDVKIAVDNMILRQQQSGQGFTKKGGPSQPPPGETAPKMPEGPREGKYIKIPYKYSDYNNSGLIYTVKRGEQTKDIDLSSAQQ